MRQEKSHLIGRVDDLRERLAREKDALEQPIILSGAPYPEVVRLLSENKEVDVLERQIETLTRVHHAVETADVEFTIEHHRLTPQKLRVILEEDNAWQSNNEVKGLIDEALELLDRAEETRQSKVRSVSANDDGGSASHSSAVAAMATQGLHREVRPSQTPLDDPKKTALFEKVKAHYERLLPRLRRVMEKSLQRTGASAVALEGNFSNIHVDVSHLSKADRVEYAICHAKCEVLFALDEALKGHKTFAEVQAVCQEPRNAGQWDKGVGSKVRGYVKQAQALLSTDEEPVVRTNVTP